MQEEESKAFFEQLGHYNQQYEVTITRSLLINRSCSPAVNCLYSLFRSLESYYQAKKLTHSLSCAHTIHIHTRIHIRTPTHTLSRTHTHTHIYTHTHVQTTHVHTHTHTYENIHTPTHTLTCMHAHARTYAYSHFCAHALSLAQTHIPNAHT